MRPLTAANRQGERLRSGAEETGMVIASPWAGMRKGDSCALGKTGLSSRVFGERSPAIDAMDAFISCP
ncbi:hypothetical protein Aab01nite_67780 [Paractinoplanes abujensis]|nr:hypothetical protein Aab01nite_67780 [Actinoplanes abujensis]